MIRSLVYDTLILRMTSQWYREVLDRVPDNIRMLDVGIGTAGALLTNAGAVRKKGISITGLDIDADYIERARTRLAASPLRNQVTVLHQSLYDHQAGPYDVIYFSGSFMLLPAPGEALRHCCNLLAPGGRIYFTQTMQQKPSPWMERLKPALRRLTSIDFGRVTYEREFRDQIRAAGLTLDEFTALQRHGSRTACLAIASGPVAGNDPGK